ncbi:MAG: type II toxin-antitoxin system RelE/ParE family toxin [Crocinitomicaceae bacterium]
MYQITIKKKAEKELDRLPKRMLPKIVSAIDELEINPQPKGSKKLQASTENAYRIRIGDYRVIYVIEEEIKIVDIRKVGHRKDVYRM